MSPQPDVNPLLQLLPGGQSPDTAPTDALAISLDELLDTEEPDYDWLVPGLVERGDRIMTTGLEGGGKSTLLRQMGVQMSYGIHPFGGADFDPIRVLVVDCENSRRQVRRKADRLRKRPDSLARFIFRPDGIDLTLAGDVAWLAAQVEAERPQLLVIGPIYKMAGGDPKDEQTAKAVARVLDELRVSRGFAVMIEAHTPYAEGSKAKRPERPYGASLWSRWPEFGIYLADDGALRHWRGQRDEREWPAKLRRGDEWPWEVEEASASGATWDGPTHCMDEVYAFLRSAKGDTFTGNRLHASMSAVGTKFRRDTVLQAAERLAAKGRIEARSGPRNSRVYSLPTQLMMSNEAADAAERSPDDDF